MATRTQSPTPTAPPRGPAGLLDRLRSPLLLTVFAWAAAITNGGIAITGATVRVTGSGLGCATWPECQPGSLVPVSRSGLAAIHQAIEFSNRTLTGVVLVASLGTFVLLLIAKPRRPQLLWLASVGPFGVLFQAVWGGIVVRKELIWWTVAPHMLVSLVLLFCAVAVVIRLREGDGPVQPVVPRPLRVVSVLNVVVLAALSIAGTLVTAAGPHGGDADTPRLEIDVQTLAQTHADLMFLYFGLVIALLAGFYAVKAPRVLTRRTWLLLALTVAQGAIGLVQYWTGVPEVLVICHVAGATALVATASTVLMATRRRAP